MRIRSNLRGTKGFVYAYTRAVRFQYMIQEEAKRRAKILTFWKKYGLEAVVEAYGVKERTLYLWQKKLREGQGKLESLNCGSRTPKNKRKRRYDYRIIEEIRRLRDTYPNLGEQKLYPLLKEYCDGYQPHVSETSNHRQYHARQGWYAHGTEKDNGYGHGEAIQTPKGPQKA